MIHGRDRHSILVLHQLDKFRDYAEYIESSFRKELEFYENGAKELQPEEEEEYYDWCFDEVSQYTQDFPRIMRNSLFVSIYTFLEDKIVEQCVSDADTLLELSDINGKGIQQASIYLKKVLRVAFPNNCKEWKYIKNANLIRNCIVHNNGAVSKSRNEKKLRNIVEDTPSICINQIDHIHLESKFCLDFIDNVDLFLSQLYNAIYRLKV